MIPPVVPRRQRETKRYDRRGLLIREEKTIGGAEYVTQYGFDPTGNLTQILYPTDDPESRQGQVDYTHDVADRVTGVLAEVNGSTTTVASAIAYKPFGPQTSLTFGNTLLDSRTYGSRYQLGTWTLGSLLNYTHTFDGDLNLGSRIDNVNAANNRAFGYDETHRLTNAAGPWGLGIGCPGGVTYTYDPNGNRLCKGEGAATTYNYITGQNRLDRTSGGETAAYSYDANGNTRGDGTHTYEYNDADRLKTVDVGATAIYTHDGDGRRVIKSVGSDTTYFFYGPGGRLLTETVPASGAGTDYVYLDGAPIGRVDWMNEEEDLGVYLRLGGDATNVLLDWTLFPADSNNYVVRRKEVVNWLDKTFDGAVTIATVTDPVQTYDDPVLDDGSRYDYRVYRNTFSESLFFYHTDHLDTPMAMTDGGRDFVWRAEYLPFGDLWSNPVSLVDSELRFPGQYRDQETGFYYNYFRTYDSSTGRYLSADPIGQAGGVNLYPYAGNDPVNWFDPFGLTEDSKANKAKRKAIAAWAAAHNQKKSTSFSFNSTYATGYSYDAKFGPQYPPAPPGSYKCSAFTCAAAAAADADTKVTVPDGRGGTVERCPTAGELAGVGRIANWRLLAPGEKRKPGDIAAGAFSSPTPGVTGHTAVVTGDQQGGTTTVGAHFHRVGPPGADIFPGGKPRYRRYIGD